MGVGIVALALFGLWFIFWVWILVSPSTPANKLSGWPGWPVACTSHGCISSATWNKHSLAMEGFAQLTDTDRPTKADSLTTLVRQQLVKDNLSGRLITKKDAKRYREEVLKINSEDAIKEGFGLTIDEYDKLVIIPLLEQEALLEQLKMGSRNELFTALAKKHKVFILLRSLGWDKEKAQVLGVE